MSINNNNLSLEHPSHFSTSAMEHAIQSTPKSKSWRLFGTSLSYATQPMKTLSEYSFESTIFDKDLSYFDFFFTFSLDISSKDISNNLMRVAKEVSQLHIDDLYDRRNLVEFIRLMNQGDAKVGYAMGNSQLCTMNTEMAQLNLNECACEYSQRFTRDEQQSIRNSFEGELINLIGKKFKNVKENTLNFLFLGSGGCLSEWKITSQAILTGFENLEIYLVDRAYAKDDAKQFPERFRQFFKKFPQVKVNTHILSSLEDFAKLNIACDLASAIDFDADTRKLPKIDLTLSENGFTFVTRKYTPPNWQWNYTEKDRHSVTRYLS